MSDSIVCDTIRHDRETLTCNEKLTNRQLNLPHVTKNNRKITKRTKNSKKLSYRRETARRAIAAMWPNNNIPR